MIALLLRIAGYKDISTTACMIKVGKTTFSADSADSETEQVTRGLSCVAARSTLGALAAGTLGSGAAGIRGRSTLGDGVMVVVGGAGIFCRSDGRRISHSCWMA